MDVVIFIHVGVSIDLVHTPGSEKIMLFLFHIRIIR